MMTLKKLHVDSVHLGKPQTEDGDPEFVVWLDFENDSGGDQLGETAKFAVAVPYDRNATIDTIIEKSLERAREICQAAADTDLAEWKRLQAESMAPPKPFVLPSAKT